MFLAGGDTHLQRLRRSQTSAARWVLYFRRSPGELWLDWWKRSWRLSREFLEEVGIRSWARLSVQLKLQWAGHVARLPPDELPQRALHFFNLAQWRRAQRDHEVYGLPLVRHPGRFHPLRWESTLEKLHEWALRCMEAYVGDTWHQAALGLRRLG
eukprot:4829843-Amphidinium_carterae.1